MRTWEPYEKAVTQGVPVMIVSTFMAAVVAAQPTPAPEPIAVIVPAAEKKMACCDAMAKGEGCACCKDMGKEAEHPEPMNHGHTGAHNH